MTDVPASHDIVPGNVPDIVPNIVQEANVRRREFIQQIEEVTKRHIINYSATAFGFGAEMLDNSDIANLTRVIGKIDGFQGVDLILTSSGGQPESAEKVIMTLRHFYDDDLRVIVPESAKSAATIVALGAQEIVMGYCSELGPIDPQVFVPDESGRGIFRSTHSIIQSVDANLHKLHEAIANGEPYLGYLRLLDFVPNLAFVEECRLAQRLAREIAERWLQMTMLEDQRGRATEIADKLSRADQMFSHSRAIDYRIAQDELGLNVRYLPPDDELWRLVWELHIRSRWHSAQNGWAKIIESRWTTIELGQQ